MDAITACRHTPGCPHTRSPADASHRVALLRGGVAVAGDAAVEQLRMCACTQARMCGMTQRGEVNVESEKGGPRRVHGCCVAMCMCVRENAAAGQAERAHGLFMQPGLLLLLPIQLLAVV